MKKRHQPWTGRSGLLWLASVLLAAGVLVSGCQKQELQRQRPAGKTALRVESAKVQRIVVQRLVEVSGTLVSPDQAKLSSEVAGVVKQILVELGQEVVPGQVLVRLEPRELELALSRAEGQLRQTEAQLGIDGTNVKELPPEERISSVRQADANREDAIAALNRARQLFGKGLLSRADLDTAETRAKVAEANYQASVELVRSLKASLQDRRASVELAQKKLNDAVIKAPVAGSVSERLVQTGEFIQQNTPVVSVVQVHPLKFRTAVQEKHAGLIQAGLPVRFRVESFPGVDFEGKVAFISPAVDQATRAFAVEVLVDNRDRRLKPGFFGKGVIMTRRDADVLAVAEDAIFTLAGESTVYVLEKGKARKQLVSLGAREGKLVEVTSGLDGNETVATSHLNELATGVVVETGPVSQANLPAEPLKGETPANASQGERP